MMSTCSEESLALSLDERRKNLPPHIEISLESAPRLDPLMLSFDLEQVPVEVEQEAPGVRHPHAQAAARHDERGAPTRPAAGDQ